MKKALKIFRKNDRKSALSRRRPARFEVLESRDLLAVTAGAQLLSAETALCDTADSFVDETANSLVAALPTGSTRLAAPTLSGVTGGGGASHIVSWEAVENALTYRLAHSTDGVVWTETETTALSVTVDGLACGNTMQYRVRALGLESGTASPWSEIASLCVCPVDVDGDGFVGPGDFAMMSGAWFSQPGSFRWNPACDVDGDGFVGPGDLSFLSCVWFEGREKIVITSLGLVYDGEDVGLFNTTEGGDSPLRSGDVISIVSGKDDSCVSITLDDTWDCYFIDSAVDPGEYQYTVRVSRPGTLYDWEGSIAFTIEEPEVQPGDITVSLQWDTAVYGLTLGWTANRDFGQDAIVDLYFSSGTAFGGIVDTAPVSVTVPAGTTAGSSGTIIIDGSLLYTEVPSNTFDSIIACLYDDVLTAIPDVTLSLNPSIVTSLINQTTYDAIKYGCRAVGKSWLRLTSGLRTPAEEAKALYDNLVRTTDLAASIATQYSYYGRVGDQVIAIFEAQAISYNYDLATVKAHGNEILTMMTNKIIEFLDAGVIMSKHCVTEEMYRAHNILDISRSGFNTTNVPIFRTALKKAGAVAVYDEPVNGCLHLEF
ncbi:MAG: hypothetical protein ACOX6D_09515 [Thermoguttaceae bacterium]|jgi:hypothetical protein